MYRNKGNDKMTNESNIKKLARSYREDGFTKEAMAEDLFKMGLDFATVVKVSLSMEYYKPEV